MTSEKDSRGTARPTQTQRSDRATDRPALDPTVTELTGLLFDRHDREQVHAPWRELISGAAFAPRPELPYGERAALSYQRLHLVNDTLANPEELALDARRLAALHEWTGVVDSGLTTLAGIHYNLFLGSLLDHDTHRRDVSRYTSLDRTGTFLCTELEHGNDAAALRTTAVLDRATGGFVLHTPHTGAQKFMANTSAVGGPKSAVVAARLLVDGEDHGVFLFLTPLSDDMGPLPGITVRPLPPRLGSPVDHCLTSFNHVSLPRTALLEADHGRLTPEGQLRSDLGNRRKRFLHSIARVTTGKLCMSAAAIGVSRTSLAIATRFAYNRHISGPKAGTRVPLAAHRSHHGRLLCATATTYAMTFLHRATVARWVEHTPQERAEAERQVAVTKGWNTWQARAIATECRERCGARGLFAANRLSELVTDLEGTITAEGDNLVIWLKAAAEMIFGHEVPPHSAPGTDPADRHLSDLAFLRDLLCDAETIWQARTRDALRQGQSGDPLARWNAASPYALELVEAHARRKAADAFLAAAERAEGTAAHPPLVGLCRLFLLKELTKSSGDLLAEQRMTVDQVRALSASVEHLIGELAPHLRTLVDAFDIPESVLAGIPLVHGDATHVDHCLAAVEPIGAAEPI
ncbi:acyl-CoA dehydrogenase [Streptomyces sp. NRRL B-1347]|uniref:acyl-CoA dehydrogenase family protein n=1 Tax=Streptomyces sp. NRRL B-1347 TaxID=1476877 RepID=UPI00099CB60F|nr:acyl-CoA dehydrogenase [Streptomyces sp. NRRL B-1347]